MLTISISVTPDESRDLAKAAAKHLRISPAEIRFLNVERKSIDARRHQLRLNYTLRVDAGRAEEKLVRRGLGKVYSPPQDIPLIYGTQPLRHRPVIVGAGPAGLMAAYKLAREGYAPLILEQGRDVEKRVEDTEKFFATGELDPLSNVQFGEGGAGAFSDGKLNTRVRDPRCAQILSLWADLLDAPEIASDARPHVGTDRLRILLPKLRAQITQMGGSFRFGAKVESLRLMDGRITGLVLTGGEFLSADAVILAPGHSARELQESLIASGITLQARPFAMGVRCEQSQDWLDRLQYGQYAGHEALGAASYSVNFRAGDVNVHSFCVCPGGEVVNASSEMGHLCVNGMSHAARDSGTINGALVVTVAPPQGADPLWGVAYQRQVERAAFLAGGGQFRAPAQRMEDFLAHRPSTGFGDIIPSVRPGAVPCDLHRVLPESLTTPLAMALMDFERRMPGFAAAQGVLTAVEARTSSPVRLPRDEQSGVSPEAEGLYPCGEGAGYAGGILSSAVDGYIQSERLIARYARPRERSL